jgi:hypothetical protein
VQTSSDHQVKHQPDVTIYTDRDSFANPPQFAHGAALNICNWRLHGSKQKRARKANPLDRLPNDPWFEGADVGGDIR